MRTKSLLSVLVLSVIVFGASACGGDDDGDTADARPMADAPTLPDAGPMIDAMGTSDASPPLMGFGAPCSAAADCTAPANSCLSTTMTPAGGFCTLSCATTTDADGDMMAGTGETPDMAANQMCVTAYQGTGTPSCGIYSLSGTTFNWSCGIFCGPYMGQDLGACPGGLTCVGSNPGICDQ